MKQDILNYTVTKKSLKQIKILNRNPKEALHTLGIFLISFLREMHTGCFL